MQIERIEKLIEEDNEKGKKDWRTAEAPAQRWTQIYESEVPIKFLYQDFESNLVLELQTPREEEKEQQTELAALINEVDKDKNLWGSKQQKDT